MRAASVVALACSMLAPVTAVWSANAPAEQPMAWLTKVMEARRSTSYEGEFVYLYGGRMSTMKVSHQVGADGVRERLYALDGALREVIRDGNKVTCVTPDDQRLVITRSRAARNWPPADPSQLGRLRNYYHIDLKERDRIAGREAQRIDVAPRGKLRYGHRVWVDTETGLVLKSELLDESGKILESVMFTEIRVLDRSPAAATPVLASKGLSPSPPAPTGPTGPTVHASAEDEPDASNRPAPEQAAVEGAGKGDPPWAVGRLPPGFTLKGYEHHSLTGANGSVDHLVYGDGLASVSVFIERLDGETAFNDLLRRGAVNLYGHTVGGYQVTVVGEVPERTVRMMGDSVSRHD